MKLLLVAYDNASHIAFQPLGLAYLASACRKAGHSVSIYQQDTHHWSDQHFTRYLDENHFDVVGLGACGGYYQYRRVLALANAINRAKARPFFVLGGTIASPEPEYFLRKTSADAVVMGEGEDILCTLLSALESKAGLAHVKGIAFLSGNSVIINERPAPPNVDMLPLPSWDLFEMEHYVLNNYFPKNTAKRGLAMLTGRGCTFHCTSTLMMNW